MLALSIAAVESDYPFPARRTVGDAEKGHGRQVVEPAGPQQRLGYGSDTHIN